jgi:hypothetical protein
LATQASPAGSLSPQRLLVIRHVRPFVQSAFEAQVLRQVGLVVLHTYEPQDTTVAVGQPPLPSQLAGRVCVLPTQLSWRQPVVLDQGRQAPAPLQVPSFEQLPVAALLFTQRDLGSAPPSATLAQVPTGLPVVPLQVLHNPPVMASEQRVSQHTPSVQKPLAHWLALVHGAPFTFRPHDPFTQVLGGMQSWASVATVQLLLQAPATHAKVPQD